MLWDEDFQSKGPIHIQFSYYMDKIPSKFNLLSTNWKDQVQTSSTCPSYIPFPPTSFWKLFSFISLLCALLQLLVYGFLQMNCFGTWTIPRTLTLLQKPHLSRRENPSLIRWHLLLLKKQSLFFLFDKRKKISLKQNTKETVL